MVPRRYLGGVLAPSSHCSIPIEVHMAGEASWENDVSIVQVAITDSTNSTILRIQLI